MLQQFECPVAFNKRLAYDQGFAQRTEYFTNVIQWLQPYPPGDVFRY
jgi:hypothetical protein